MVPSSTRLSTSRHPAVVEPGASAPSSGAFLATFDAPVRLPPNVEYERGVAHVMHGSRMSVPTFTYALPAGRTDKQNEEILAKIRQKTGKEWDIRFVETGGKVHAEIREDLRMAYVLKSYLAGNREPRVAFFHRHIDEIDVQFASIANPICKEFERLWHTHTEGRAKWRPELQGLSIYNPDADRRHYTQIVQSLLEDNFAVGEAHQDLQPQQFLKTNMALFKQAGFSTVYMEGLLCEQQAALDAYLAGPEDAPIPLEIQTVDLNDVLRAAKTAGVRVVALDSDFALASTLGQIDQQNWYRSRIAGFNCRAVQIIQADEAHRQGGKFILHVGADHLHDRCSSMAGISQALMIKSVLISDINGDNHRGESRPPRYALMTHDNLHLVPSERQRWMRDALDGKADIFIGASLASDMSAHPA